MKAIPKANIIAILILSISFNLINCSEKTENSGHAKIKLSTNGCAALFRITHDSIDEITLVEASLDSVNGNYFDLRITKSTLAFLQVGEIWADLYLEPEYDLQISIDCKKETTHFFGVGSQANNYLAHIRNLNNQFRSSGGQFFTQLKPSKFLTKYDSFKNTLTGFHLNFIENPFSIDTTSERILDGENRKRSRSILNDKVKILLENKTKILLLNLKLEYSYLLLNNALNEQVNNAENNKPVTPFLMPPGLKDIKEEVPLDTGLLEIGTYRQALYLLSQIDIYSQPFDASTWRKNISDYPKTSYNVIKTGDYDYGIKQFLLAVNLQNSFSNFGPTIVIMDAFNDYKTIYSASPYLPWIQKTINKFYALEKGQPAPEIIGITTTGDTLSLSELKGNIVYVDVWATWCGPCREEIPHSKKLQKFFTPRDKVIFLNVSTDKDTTEWAKMLKADPQWKGTHINQQQNELTKSIYESYLIGGIPHYILIDKEGKIVNANAERPSSGKIKQEIEELLKL